jgi:muramoyltetrapeptide carboxypeptidase LdcA involved in peptidoglycan recycling
MSSILFPPPLQRGDTIGVTAPSAGVGPELEARLQFCLQTVHDLGYGVRAGQCLRSDGMVSAPPAQRAEELSAMLLDDSIHAVIPPWGGELLIDLLPRLDFKRLAQARPKWVLGYSDLTTFMLPYTLCTHIATAHGGNLMEAPMRQEGQPLAYWNDVLTLPQGSAFTQGAASHYQVERDDWREHPLVTSFNCTEPVRWKCLHHEDEAMHEATVRGRLIGGCLDVVSTLPGTPYGDVNAFAAACAPEGLLVYLENCDGNTAQYARMLYGVKLSGWFKHANAVLLGRSAGPQLREFTVRDAVMSALGDLRVPVIYDMDIGHVPPQMLLVNGASATLHFGPQGHTLTQVLGGE